MAIVRPPKAAATSRRRSGPDRRSVLLSTGGHVLAVLVAWAVASLRPERPHFETVRIQLFSPPPAQAAEIEEAAVPEEELVVEEPDPQPEEAPPPPEQKEEVTPPPEQRPEPPKPEPTPDPPEEKPRRATTTDPEAKPSEEGGEDLNVRLEGLRRDYPQYYGNIVAQLGRCFRPPPGRHSATVQFVIHRDGTVSDIRKVESTGNLAFDVRAIEAVECAGRDGHLGPLPDDFAWDVLPIEFFFAPRGG
ncbi:MAG: TonB C-terminal domain-containing protein [Gemmatimonadota bacterium]